MKALINVITNTQIAVARETFPNFSGTFTFNGTQFIPGEWVHVADDFVVSGTGHAYILEVHEYLRLAIRRIIKEHGLQAVAQGIREFHLLHSQTEPAIVEAVLNIQPYEPPVLGD